MSAKYQRVKQADLALPAPLRWLTRAFSSITLAVCLLVTICLFGLFASVPVGFIAAGGVYAVMVVGTLGLGVLLSIPLIRPTFGRIAAIPTGVRALGVIALIVAGGVAAVLSILQARDWVAHQSWFIENRARVIYRLPAFEMTELEFYNWWPMQLVLGLFVLNMVWATLRRIEFKFANIGVLTVHTGIVTIALGSILYGSAKVEGDTLLWRKDLGGEPVSEFYDGTTPALFVLNERGERMLMLSLDDLPRYNDYHPDEPDAPDFSRDLSENPYWQQVFGDKLDASIPGFLAYADLVPEWADAEKVGASTFGRPNPALRVASGYDAGPMANADRLLVSGVPAQRVMEQAGWAAEFLFQPSGKRIEELATPIAAPHVLRVEIPSEDFSQAYPIEPDQTLKLGDTGYTARIEAIGPYGMSFATRGYEGATDTRAMVHVTGPGKDFKRIVMHRYPERSQDFVPAPDDPTVGPMGRRTDPDPTVRMTYLDNSKVQFHIYAQASDLSDLSLVARVPGHEPMTVPMSVDKLRLPSAPPQATTWLYITEKIRHAVQRQVPRETPPGQRDPKEEGTYLHALMPLELSTDEGWSRRLWMAHMRYPKPEYADDVHRPVGVDVPGVGRLFFVFSRVAHDLPFQMTLTDFEMQPYPGSTIPRDYVSTLDMAPVGADAPTEVAYSYLNNPLKYQGFKLSQTGWDPGDPQRPGHEARNEQGNYINQQRYTILGVGNNVGIRIIFVGSCLVVAGIPWAFYVKPWLVQRQKRRIQAQVAAGEYTRPRGKAAAPSA